jgi:hypothetical protein
MATQSPWLDIHRSDDPSCGPLADQTDEDGESGAQTGAESVVSGR